tara:strand:+ start:129 stop:419 length:291 start_codon:yes stop_codon:yes gene_type:complete
MNEDELRNQIDSLIRSEIQEVINDYVDDKENQVFSMEKNGVGFVESDEEKELKVNISKREIDKLIKKYKKIKKSQRSNLAQVKKMGLVDKNGKPLK